MPIYEFVCRDCGTFSAMRRMADSRAPSDCPQCGATSRRVIASAPRLSRVSRSTRVAHETNERSSHAPHTTQTYGGGHPAGCGCASHGKSRQSGPPPAVQTQTGPRPWMISH
ncbi:FmdB family zinc ribbon protein [Salinisphaera aquimarina]|uniref:Zinc ribbon domain-containing protein n=1 Tax=Salinisphaera aquimarina TaxID=2094031 RepID=A0ABV7EWV8_9GAMM